MKQITNTNCANYGCFSHAEKLWVQLSHQPMCGNHPVAALVSTVWSAVIHRCGDTSETPIKSSILFISSPSLDTCCQMYQLN